MNNIYVNLIRNDVCKVVFLFIAAKKLHRGDIILPFLGRR
jgi:hypothetical protein